MRRTVLLLLLFLIVGCGTQSKLISKPTGYSTIVIDDRLVSETTTAPKIYFCPRDNCSEHLVEQMNNAQYSIHCALFDLRLSNVITALNKKNIDIKVVVDNDNYKYVKELGFTRQDDSNQLSHNKFCIFDHKTVWTGSFNPTTRGDTMNNNNVIVYDSEYLSMNYEDELEELWNGEFGTGNRVRYPVVYINENKVENYFCPEDNCADHVIETLNTANESIYFMAFSFTHELIGNVLINKHYEGLDIKGVFEKTQDTKWSERQFLEDEGIDVRTDTNPANMHHKVFIIDKETVITGSFNPSKNADTRNDENVLIIHDKDVAAKYLEEFELVFPKG